MRKKKSKSIRIYGDIEKKNQRIFKKKGNFQNDPTSILKISYVFLGHRFYPIRTIPKTLPTIIKTLFLKLLLGKLRKFYNEKR